MSKMLTTDHGADKSVVDLLRFLLDTEKVSGVLTLRKTNTSGSLDYGLLTRSQELDRAVPLMPVMPANAAQSLSLITPTQKPIAVVVKPCELRGFVERIKREQGSLDNVLTLSPTCGGVIPLDTYIKKSKDNLTKDYYKQVKAGEIPESIRPTCKACEYFVPMTADITVSVVGEQNLDSKCRFILNSDKAVSMTEGFGSVENGDLDAKILDDHLKKREKEKKALFESIKFKQDGLDGMIDVFGKCIGCHGCSRVCPICYCLLCDFESRNFDQNVSLFEKELEQKGALRLPPDTLFFHLGRMSHMSFSCVGCGQCTDVCPADIPVASVFKKIGENTAALFDYVPGKDVNEDIPVLVFKEEEFKELGE
ncbi:Coenzyme F420 hydrogenase/dehydrogenase, beta subunit C-terminal domain [candidate division KSB1 bacterium]|nr:Coenzyme F420 hydrogenase/dehydrogenase, beta subunit C-terminal domain [candidate division KSB1 bacterium]